MRLLFAALLLLAQDKPQAFTDPEKAGPDFLVQGEYEGEGRGAQVVARGEGKFDVFICGGGLPGAGWDGKARSKAGAVPEGMKRVVRKSPTEGAKAPEGAVVLFDGTNADAWEKGKIVEGNLLYNGTKTKRKFRDVRLHVEFRMCWGPRWPDRSNSGVYLGGRHEVQIIDSFGKDDPGTGDCGGIYETAKPKINMCFPPLQWQTFDIEYRMQRYDDTGKKTANARMTVDHNGVRIHENVEIPKATRAFILDEANEPGPIHLQDHGSPVVFRNVWAVELN